MIYAGPFAARRGFTIVELVVVIVVIGILAAVTIVSYANVTHNAKIQTVKTDAQGIASSLMRYKASNGSFPSQLSALTQTPAAESTFQYTYTAATDTFCVTASVEGASAWVKSESAATARDGKCPGH